MSAPKIPNVQNPQTTITQQTQANTDALHATQAAQSTNQDTPYGTLNYSITGQDPYGNPLYTAKTDLSADQKAILDNLESNQIGLGTTGNNLIGNVSNLYGNAPDFSEQAGTQTKINMDRQLAYLSPYFNQQTNNLDNKLRNQGLVPGTVAYDNAMRTVRDNQNQSVMSFLNQTQNQSFNQAQTQYTQPLQTISAILGLTQPGNVANSLVNTPKPTQAATDVGGIVNASQQAQMERYKAQLGQYNAMMSGIMGAGTTAMSFI